MQIHEVKINSNRAQGVESDSQRAQIGSQRSENEVQDGSFQNLPLKSEDFKRILQVQNQRNRSMSCVQRSSHVPNLKPIEHFGHGRRSQLEKKAQQLISHSIRSHSMAMSDKEQHQLLLQAQFLINQQKDLSQMQVMPNSIVDPRTNQVVQGQYIFLT